MAGDFALEALAPKGKPPIAGNPINYALRRNHASAKLAQGFGRIGAAVPLLMESAPLDEALSE